jgi:phage gpG-like protein
MDVLRDIETRLKQYLTVLPTKVGGWAVEFYKGSFSRQGFIDSHYERWIDRKSKPDQSRAILVKTGRLKRSIRVLGVNHHSVIIGTDVPYAQVHNEGETVNIPARTRVINFARIENNKVRFSRKRTAQFSQKINTSAYSFNMPQRQFIGESEFLEKRIEARIEKDILKIFNT